MRQKHTGPRLLGLLLALLLLAQTALAVGGSDLTLCYHQEGAVFRLYRVAQAQADGWRLTGDFADYSVSLPGDGWREEATTLAAYAARDALTADRTGAVAGGQVTFSGLEDGLYLVVGESTTADGWRDTPAPFLVAVAGEDVTSQVKYDREEAAETVSCAVQKAWAGDEAAQRPQAVTVQLLCDGAVYETVTLTASDGWSYAWTGLAADHTWQMAEADVPEGYTVSVSREGTLFTVTNTLADTADQDDASGGDTSGATSSGNTSDGSSSGGTASASSSGGASASALPQTGQLWWPVGLLAAAGVALTAYGLAQARKKDEEKN